ncbi:E3 ubiquitin-protein ligase BIG BROTHER-like [Quercus robur]|uniref:E3 ubiquitin-protein ligase BIG BROTHER-like n=1 Tax=Quercus robur TaxID=38942 RepID=UPI00216249E3|nr:E3 ubiquitin-protein ligase BIG BROTHER-like [Quercus robur]
MKIRSFFSVMIVVEKKEEEEEEEEEEEDACDDYDGAVLFIDYGDDDEGGIYYNESPEDAVDDDSDDERLIVGLKVVNIEEGSSLLLGGECAVCLEQFRVGWHAKLPCSHIFHRNCILQWLRMSDFCPLCRHKMA